MGDQVTSQLARPWEAARKMPSTLRLEELNRNQLRDIAPHAVVVVPVGAIEQHGPHLPVGTDFLIVEYVARAAAERAAEEIPVLVAPALPYGSSHHHLPWGGTMSLSTDVFFKAALDLACSLAASGFGRILLLNGHGGNDELLQLVARDASLQQPVDVAAGSYWKMAWDSLVETGAATTGFVPGHSGAFETALILAINPSLATSDIPMREPVALPDDQSLVGPYSLWQHRSWEDDDGYSDSPGRATPSDGERYLDAIVAAVGAAIIKFYRETASVSP